MRDRSNETSNTLTDVRTVLSRAETALYDVRRSTESERDPDQPGYDRDNETWEEYLDRAYIRFEDEDKDEMTARLEQVVELLSPWRGKRRRKSWRRDD
ncbi:hypothetical protein ACXJJ3_32875 [Kribbella sp. WER1]